MRRWPVYASVLLSLVWALSVVSHDAFARDHGPRFANSSSNPT
ncbi:hypothetical protein AWB72_02533 [Caballeronia concitans]|uniref:Uncharacterized protein n=1 Tax=Caballeronia concitans TaxID=1777133 RepID=A0A658QWZ8_9BURK|nr:hypothetical protein BurMR1_4822 [Burkholderia sp. MR1]SAL30162.1 hypothetical protein AWB72_02533 [Caballeronia concitans]